MIRYPLTTEKARTIKAKLDQLRGEQTAAANGGTTAHLKEGGQLKSSHTGSDAGGSAQDEGDADGGSGERSPTHTSTKPVRHAEASENLRESVAASVMKS